MARVFTNIVPDTSPTGVALQTNIAKERYYTHMFSTITSGTVNLFATTNAYTRNEESIVSLTSATDPNTNIITSYNIERTRVVNIDARNIIQEPGTKVASIENFSQTDVTAQPTYNTVNGFNGLPYISFRRTTSQFIQTPSLTLNIVSNGGFTATALVRFTGTGMWERVFDFGNGQNNNNIVIGRHENTNDLQFSVNNDATMYMLHAPVQIVNNTWMLITARYRTSDNLIEILVNGTRVASGTVPFILTNRTLTSNYIGRSNWTGNQFSNIDIAYLYVSDIYLGEQYQNYYTNALEAKWGQWMNGSLDSSSLQCVIADRYNSVYMTGNSSVSGTVLPGQNSSTERTKTTSGRGVFLVKYFLNGLAHWGRWIEGPGEDLRSNVETDASGNIYVCLDMTANSGTVITLVGFNAGQNVQITKPSSGAGILILKLKSVFVNLVEQPHDYDWHQWIDGTGGDYVPNFTMDISNNLYVIGKSTSNNYTLPGTNTPKTTSTEEGFIVKYDSNGNAIWGLWSTFIPDAIAVDSSQNIYVSGGVDASANTVTLPGTNPESERLKPSNLGGVFVLSYNISGNARWGRWIDGNGAEFATNGGVARYSPIAIDSNNKVWMSCYVGSTTPSDFLYNIPKPSSYGGSFIGIFTTNGAFETGWWIDSTGADYVSSIESDKNGNVYILGYSNAGGLVLPGINPLNERIRAPSTPPVEYSAYLIKYRYISGTIQAVSGHWIDGVSNEFSHSIAIDNSNRVIVTGTSGSSNYILPGLNPVSERTQVSGNIGFIVSYGLYDANIQFEQTYTIPTQSGWTINTYSIGSGTNAIYGIGSRQLNSNTSFRDLFLTRMDENCNFTWIKQVYNSLTGVGSPRIALDANNNIFVVHTLSSLVSFADADYSSTDVSHCVHSGGADVVVLKFDASGNLLWVQQNANFNTSATEGTNLAISIDSNNDIVVVCQTTGSFPDTSGNIGLTDCFVFKLNGSNGAFLWRKMYGQLNSIYDEYAPSVQTDNQNNIYVSYTTGVMGASQIGQTNGQSGSNNIRDLIVLYKLDPNGSIVWNLTGDSINLPSLTSSTFGSREYILPALRISPSGFLYVVISVYFGSSTNYTLPNGSGRGGDEETAIIKLDLNGNILASSIPQGINSPNIDRNAVIMFDNNENLYILKNRGHWNLDWIGNTNLPASLGVIDLVLSCVDKDLNYVFDKNLYEINGTGFDNINTLTDSITFDPKKQILYIPRGTGIAKYTVLQTPNNPSAIRFRSNLANTSTLPDIAFSLEQNTTYFLTTRTTYNDPGSDIQIALETSATNLPLTYIRTSDSLASNFVSIQSVSSVNDVAMLLLTPVSGAIPLQYKVYIYEVSSQLVRVDIIPVADVVNSVIRITNLLPGTYAFRVSLVDVQGESDVSVLSGPTQQYIRFIPNNSIQICTSGGGTFIGNSTRFPGIATNGLLAYYDFNSPFTYNGTSNIFNLMNLTNDATIRGAFSHSNGRLALLNSNADATQNNARVQLNTLSNVRTISMWVNISSFQGIFSNNPNNPEYYLLDARTGTSQSWIWSRGVGTMWTGSNSALYINASNQSPIVGLTNSKYPRDTWTNLTLQSESNITDDITLFCGSGVVNFGSGMNCQVGNVLLYNRILTPQEITTNYNTLARNFM